MVDTVTSKDDYFHKESMTDSPFWNESAWFPFYVAERSLSGFVYMNHRPNMNFSMTGVALWDPSGENMWDCVYHDWLELAPLNADSGTEMFDYDTPNSLSVRCLEPLQTFTMQYDHYEPVPQHVRKAQQERQRDPAELQMVGQLLEIDRAGGILGRVDENVAVGRDREVAFPPPVHLVQFRGVVDGEDLTSLPCANTSGRATHAMIIHRFFWSASITVRKTAARWSRGFKTYASKCAAGWQETAADDTAEACVVFVIDGPERNSTRRPAAKIPRNS